MHLLTLLPVLFQLSASSAITGPKAVSGQEQGSLTVQCRYSREWELYLKWWCRGADWGSCTILVRTLGSEQEVKRGRVSIRDNRKNFTFTVTMEKLRLDDADTYWCGIERVGSDLGVPIGVTVDPAPTTVPATTSTINTSTARVVSEDDSPNMTSHGSNGSIFRNLSALLPLIFAVLLLLLVVASLVVWRMLKQQKKGAATAPEQVLQPLEGDLCYANLSLREAGSSRSWQRKVSTRPSSSAQDNQEDMDYVAMAPFPKGDIAYAALSLDTLSQEPTYGNVGDLGAHVPSGSQEEPIEYSTIKKA